MADDQQQAPQTRQQAGGPTPPAGRRMPEPTVDLAQVATDLQSIGWKFEQRKAPNGMDFLVSGFLTEPDKVSVMFTVSVSYMFIWVTTQELIMNVDVDQAPVLLAANSKLPMGKLFMDNRPLSIDPSNKVNIAEYTFEIADALYSQQTLLGNLDLMVQNVDWLMHEFLSKGVVKDDQVWLQERVKQMQQQMQAQGGMPQVGGNQPPASRQPMTPPPSRDGGN